MNELLFVYTQLEIEYTALAKSDYSKEKLQGYKDALWDLSLILKHHFNLNPTATNPK